MSKSNRARLAMEEELLVETPDKAAQQLDALLFFIHKRYSSSKTPTSTPHLGKFLITRAEVIFTSKLNSIQIQKRPEKNVLQILAPLVDAEAEEKRRIYLLNEFSELILKCQKQAYLQIREMVLRITDPASHEVLITEYQSQQSQRKSGRKN